MGLEESKISKEYYDKTFGYKFGRPLESIAPTDMNKLVYVPSKKPQTLLQSPPVSVLNRPAPLKQSLLQKPQPLYSSSTSVEPKSKKKKDKKDKTKKNDTPVHPQTGMTYFYYEKPDIIYYPTMPYPNIVPVKTTASRPTKLRQSRLNGLPPSSVGSRNLIMPPTRLSNRKRTIPTPMSTQNRPTNLVY